MTIYRLLILLLLVLSACVPQPVQAPVTPDQRPTLRKLGQPPGRQAPWDLPSFT